MPDSSRTSPRTTPAKCANCDRPMNSPLVCDSCRTLYPADGLNHFELLGLDPTFDLDPAELRRGYLRLSRDAHPDHRGTAGDSALSLQVSAQLNEANRVLGDPVLRAEYLLELSGGSSAAQDKSVSPDVLSTTLLLREQIAEAEAAGRQNVADECRARVRQRRETTLADIAHLARQLPGSDETRAELRATLNAIKYYNKLLSEQ